MSHGTVNFDCSPLNLKEPLDLRRTLMYQWFCRNLETYLDINKDGDFENEYRLKITKPLVVMADLELYNKLKSGRDILFDEVCNLIFEIDRNMGKYRSFETFSWDLWGYGFDKKQSNLFHAEIVEEQLKLINLLLGCHYWIAA